MERKYEIVPFARDQVLDVLRSEGKPLVWSVIAARILGCERKDVKISQVRGVRDAVRSLQADGLVREPKWLAFVAA